MVNSINKHAIRFSNETMQAIFKLCILYKLYTFEMNFQLNSTNALYIYVRTRQEKCGKNGVRRIFAGNPRLYAMR